MFGGFGGRRRFEEERWRNMTRDQVGMWDNFLSQYTTLNCEDPTYQKKQRSYLSPWRVLGVGSSLMGGGRASFEI
jgi:hypothetical protein